MTSRRKIVVCDCETDPFLRYRVPSPFVWGYFDGDHYRQFPPTPTKNSKDVTDAFVDFLKEQPVICYAHNGGKFDWHFLLPHLNAYDDVMIINGRLAKINIGVAECRDSYNIIPVPLAAYKKDSFDYSIMEPDERETAGNWAKISKYLKNDCVYLYELVSRFVENYGVHLTQASAAFAQWKKISKRRLPRTDADFYDEFVPYYYGGRVECFESGVINTQFSIYDINSAYPYAMLQEHPYSEEYSYVDGYEPDADFYKVVCRSSGAFPIRGLGGDDSRNFGLRFPSDEVIREYTVTRWEYDAAIETKTIHDVEVVESILFAERVSFKDYVHHFYQMRLRAKERGDEAMSLFCKLFLNSSYGKFAQNPDDFRRHMVCPWDLVNGLKGAGWDFAGELGPWALASAELTDAEKRYYNIATSASITGYVRAMLWRAIASSHGVMYCDTDCVVARQPGSEIKLGRELGEWTHEGNYDKAGVAGKKLYIFRGVPEKGKRKYKMASKGVRLTQQQLWSVARGGNVDYVPEVPTFSAQKAPVFTVRHIKNTA